MVLITLLLSLFFVSFEASAASAVESAFRSKDYNAVAMAYRNSPNADYSRKELVIISYSLRKMKFYRQDIKLNLRLIKKHYLPEHRKLMTAIKRGDTVDGEEYGQALKVLYWNLFSSYGAILKGYSEDSPKVEKDNKQFITYSKLLSEVEFRERKVDKFNDLIIAHRQNLKNKIFRFKASWSLQYVSWQSDATLKVNGTGETGLIVTNKGFCAGGDAGYENARYHFFVDGCIMYGSGGVKNNDTSLIDDYQQANVPAMGVKMGPGASIIVSSSRSRIGVKLPIIYSIQELTVPDSPLYSIDQPAPLSIVGSIYSRWQFDRWYFQTEFGKYLTAEQTFWGFGIGQEF